MIICSKCDKKFRTKRAISQHDENVHLSQSEKRLKQAKRKNKSIQKKYATLNPKTIKFKKSDPSDSSTSPYQDKDEKTIRKIREAREADTDTFTRGR